MVSKDDLFICIKFFYPCKFMRIFGVSVKNFYTTIIVNSIGPSLCDFRNVI